MSDADWSPLGTDPHRRSRLPAAGMIGLALLIGAPAAYVASSQVDPTYTAESALWIEPQGEGTSMRARSNGPAAQPLAQPWIGLLRSPRLLEQVAEDHRLYLVAPMNHEAAFRSFSVSEGFTPGAYALRLGARTDGFVLVTAAGSVVQRGVLGAPVGEALGFDWTPPPGSFPRHTTVAFSVLSLTDAGRALSRRLTASMHRDGNVLRIGLEGADEHTPVAVLNSLMQRYVDLANELKFRKLAETLGNLEAQVATVDRELEVAERDLEQFRMRLDTRPSGDEERRTGSVDVVVDASGMEAPLARRVDAVATLRAEVTRRAEEAKLRAATAIPDVRILDPASARAGASHDARLPIAIAVLFGFVGLTVGGGLLWGRRAVRFEHDADGVVTEDAGDDVTPVLAILGGALLALIATFLRS